MICRGHMSLQSEGCQTVLKVNPEKNDRVRAAEAQVCHSSSMYDIRLIYNNGIQSSIFGHANPGLISAITCNPITMQAWSVQVIDEATS